MNLMKRHLTFWTDVILLDYYLKNFSWKSVINRVYCTK